MSPGGEVGGLGPWVWGIPRFPPALGPTRPWKHRSPRPQAGKGPDSPSQTPGGANLVRGYFPFSEYLLSHAPCAKHSARPFS